MYKSTRLLHFDLEVCSRLPKFVFLKLSNGMIDPSVSLVKKFSARCNTTSGDKSTFRGRSHCSWSSVSCWFEFTDDASTVLLAALDAGRFVFGKRGMGKAVLGENPGLRCMPVPNGDVKVPKTLAILSIAISVACSSILLEPDFSLYFSSTNSEFIFPYFSTFLTGVPHIKQILLPEIISARQLLFIQ